MSVETELKRVADALETQVSFSKKLLGIALKAEKARAEILVRDAAAQAMFEKEMDRLRTAEFGGVPAKDN